MKFLYLDLIDSTGIILLLIAGGILWSDLSSYIRLPLGVVIGVLGRILIGYSFGEEAGK